MRCMLRITIIGVAALAASCSNAGDDRATLYFSGWESTVLRANSAADVRARAPFVVTFRGAPDVAALQRSLNPLRDAAEADRRGSTIVLVLDIEANGRSETVLATHLDLCFETGCVPLTSEFMDRLRGVRGQILGFDAPAERR